MRVFGFKLSVFGGNRRVLSVDEMESRLIRVPGFGRYQKATVGIGRLGNFRFGNGTAKVLPDGLEYANIGMGGLRSRQGLKGKAVGGGSYRQLAAVQKNIFVGMANGKFRISNWEIGRWMKVVEGGCSWMKVKIFLGTKMADWACGMRNLKLGRRLGWMGGIWKYLTGSDKGILEKVVGSGFLLDEGRGLGQVVCCQGPWNVDLQIPPGQECSNGSLLCIRRGHPGLIYFDCGVRNAGESFIPHFL